MNIVSQTDLKEYPLLSRGKVRDIYAIDDERLLIVTTDRISAFDVILPDPIPYKGAVLNSITVFWMDKFKDILPNHLLATDVKDFPKALQAHADMLEGRAVIAKRAKPLPIECIVRGYLTGSGLKDYQATGRVSGHVLPAGLQPGGPVELLGLFRTHHQHPLGGRAAAIDPHDPGELAFTQRGKFAADVGPGLLENGPLLVAQPGGALSVAGIGGDRSARHADHPGVRDLRRDGSGLRLLGAAQQPQLQEAARFQPAGDLPAHGGGRCRVGRREPEGAPPVDAVDLAVLTRLTPLTTAR